MERSRQSGKSTMSGVIALHRALYQPGSLVLCLAPSERQSKELFAKVSDSYRRLRGTPAPASDRKLGMRLPNGSRIEALPGSEKTVRGFSGTSLLIVDEAARVDDELYHAVKPMLAVSGGSLFGTVMHLRHLQRYPLRTSYTTIADGVVDVVRSETLNGDEYDPARHRVARAKAELLVDKTGVGRGVTDILKERGLRFTGIVIHGGETTHKTNGSYHVPKKDLVAALEVPFDRGTLKIAEGLELWPALREELQSFRRKQNPKTAHVSFEHWRDSDHDDLVLAVAMACWGATSRRPRRTVRVIR